MLDITGLSLEEKRQLAAQLSYELGARAGTSAHDLPSHVVDFWESLQDAIGYRGKARQSISGFVKTAGKRKLEDAATLVSDFVAEGSSRGMAKAGRIAVTTAVLSCLVAHLKARNIPVSAGVMLRSLGVLPDAVDRRFPGYHAAKLIDRIALRVA